MDILLIISFLIFSAFFSGSETAFLSLGKVRFQQIKDMNTNSSRRVISLLSDPHRLLITILIGNTLVNIAASSLMADMLYGFLGEKGVGVSILLMTIILLIFGEVTPKMFALAKAQGYAFFAAGPLFVFRFIFAPIRFFLDKISGSFVKAMGVKIYSGHPKVTEQDLRHLFTVGKSKGIVKEKEKDMIESILEFKDLNVADIMTPRIDVETLDLTENRGELIERIKSHQYSRLPVYFHNRDNIAGIIHAKDFLLNPDLPIKDIVRKPFFVPESMKIDDLLHELQHQRVHMAIVTDEYGVTSGVVTIEDILEEIVGEIRDELDFEKPKIKKIDQKTYEVDGLVHINEINDEISLGIETEEVDTIGGYVVLKMGKIPQAGDSIEIDGYRFTVGDVSRNRITSLKIELLEL